MSGFVSSPHLVYSEISFVEVVTTNTMSPPRPSTAQSDKSTAEDPQSPATTTQAGQSSHDVAVKENLSTPESPEPKQSMSKTALVIVSVLLGSLLVSLDRNIITPVRWPY